MSQGLFAPTAASLHHSVTLAENDSIVYKLTCPTRRDHAGKPITLGTWVNELQRTQDISAFLEAETRRTLDRR
jgi:hypothetical protein